MTGGLAAVGCCLAVLSVVGLWVYAGSYGLHVLLRHGGTYWITVAPDSPRLSPSMRLAFGAAPTAIPGPLSWRAIGPGFEVAEVPALVDGQAVDTLLLARIDPARFRFEVRNASDGDKGLDQWMSHLRAALVVNGSYYAIDGKPDTPFLADGVPLGPTEYDARAGAFVASPQVARIYDLAAMRWQDAFQGSTDAMVSYPMLIANGPSRVPHPSRWLANRSFVGQDAVGLVIISTTTDAGVVRLRIMGRRLLGAFLEFTPWQQLRRDYARCEGRGRELRDVGRRLGNDGEAGSGCGSGCGRRGSAAHGTLT